MTWTDKEVEELESRILDLEKITDTLLEVIATQTRIHESHIRTQNMVIEVLKTLLSKEGVMAV